MDTWISLCDPLLHSTAVSEQPPRTSKIRVYRASGCPGSEVHTLSVRVHLLFKMNHKCSPDSKGWKIPLHGGSIKSYYKRACMQEWEIHLTSKQSSTCIYGIFPPLCESSPMTKQYQIPNYFWARSGNNQVIMDEDNSASYTRARIVFLTFLNNFLVV